MKYIEIYKKGEELLRQASISESSLDARLLLEMVCGTDRNTLLAHPEMEVSKEMEEDYLQKIETRAKHVPLQHITGTQNFMGFDFSVNGDVLVPRQDTECLVEEVLQNLHDGFSFLDMCTGSGCIAVSLLALSNDCRAVAADISKDALVMANKNATSILEAADITMLLGDETSKLNEKFRENDLPGSKKSLIIVESNLFDKIDLKFDIIVSNPPYIREDDIPSLSEEVKDHDPFIALNGGKDGLDFYREITKKAVSHLNRGGMLFYEIGCDEGEDVKTIMEEEGFKEVCVKQDLSGLDRVVFGTYF